MICRGRVQIYRPQEQGSAGLPPMSPGTAVLTAVLGKALVQVGYQGVPGTGRPVPGPRYHVLITQL
jgi:hypothetical protein